MTENIYLGTIMLFAFDFAPAGWMTCEGQLLDVNQHPALYNLFQNYYGGVAGKTFALPNLKDASPLSNMKYYIATEGIYPQRPY